MGRFTDPHFLRRAKSRKSPKRPALPGAVIWVWAVHRPTPFNLLLFFTPPGALIRGFFQSCLCGAEFGFLGPGTGRFPTLGRKPPHGPSQARETRCFSAGKDGCCAPEGFSGSEPQARFCTRGRIWLFGAWVGSVPHPGEKARTQALTGRNKRGLGPCCWAQKSRCPVLSDSGLLIA